MYLFAIAAGMMTALHLVAAVRRPRLAIFVAAILWLLYAVYEHQVASGVLCDANCNIRIDLVFFLPILALATYCAYQAYMGRTGKQKIAGTILGLIILFVFCFFAEVYGYGDLASLVFFGALAAVIVYFVMRYRARAKAKQS